MKIFAMKGEFLTFGNGRGKKDVNLFVQGGMKEIHGMNILKLNQSFDSGYIKEVISVHLEVWIPLYNRQVKPYTVSSHSCSNGFRFVNMIKEMGRLLQDGEKRMDVLATVRNEPEHTYSP